MQRPDFKDIKTGAEFNSWYWLKAEMMTICKQAKLPTTGSKFELRDRIMYALDNDGAVLKKVKKQPTSKFKWSKADLKLDTVITDNITFGQNLRRFMTAQIGDHFSFNTDFMAWAKANAGKTLQDAVLKWQALENRKNDPNFKTNIANHNMLNQYVRDFLADNTDKSFKDALAIWKIKKTMPTDDGFIRYHSGDLDLKS